MTHLRRTCTSLSVKAAIRHIERNYRGSVSLSRLSEELGMTKEHLSTLFCRETGHPFTYYCNAFRINRSLYYLHCSDYTIAKIARLVGFQSSSYFIKVFKALSGLSPEKYRERISQANISR